MLVVISIAGCSPQNMETIVKPNFTSVPILLRFLRHGEIIGKIVPGLFERSVRSGAPTQRHVTSCERNKSISHTIVALEVSLEYEW